jgi:hypothetical protein
VAVVMAASGGKVKSISSNCASATLPNSIIA